MTRLERYFKQLVLTLIFVCIFTNSFGLKSVAYMAVDVLCIYNNQVYCTYICQCSVYRKTSGHQAASCKMQFSPPHKVWNIQRTEFETHSAPTGGYLFLVCKVLFCNERYTPKQSAYVAYIPSKF